MEKKFLTEAMGTHEQWFARASQITTKEELIALIDEMIDGYSHDMVTSVAAMAAGALATIHYMNSQPEGGLTQAQHQALLGQFVRRWTNIDGPAKVVAWFGMLHAGNQKAFTHVPKAAFELIQLEAKKMLEAAKPNEPKEQIEHLKKIASGTPPWGYGLS